MLVPSEDEERVDNDMNIYMLSISKIFF